MNGAAVEDKLTRMVSCLETYSEELEEGDFEAAFEAADAIGNGLGADCPLCSALSSSLSAGVALAGQFPNEETQAEIVSMLTRIAEEEADEIRAELG